MGDRLQFYCTPFSDLNMLLNLLSMLGGLSFSGQGAVRRVFMYASTMRIGWNSFLAAADGYRNLILDANERIFQEQIELFTMFFGTDRMTDE